MYENKTIQSAVLNECKDRNIVCRIFMSNGFQMQGSILAHDENVVVMDIDGKHQMLYKHNISTIAPMGALKCIK